MIECQVERPDTTGKDLTPREIKSLNNKESNRVLFEEVVFTLQIKSLNNKKNFYPMENKGCSHPSN
ncbi:MAG: hypothetical protein J7604_09155 [Sporocytophaga sp.]|uniref:hypothetical protein n=1 Tax=Sporocytophaga sp. TaxID=2231183 RepID=UPI001B15C05E|nr:hypothetical protein [Sporocytophaga sp.]MBO9700362.1 hypothetical protein [Sporocytophaga sp.]